MDYVLMRRIKGRFKFSFWEVNNCFDDGTVAIYNHNSTSQWSSDPIVDGMKAVGRLDKEEGYAYITITNETKDDAQFAPWNTFQIEYTANLTEIIQKD